MKDKGDHLAESTWIRWFSRCSGGEAGPCERWPKATQGDYQARVHLEKMVLVVVRQGAVLCEHWKKKLNEILEQKGNYQTRVYLDRMAHLVVRQGGWMACMACMVAKDAQGKVGSATLGSQGTY
jgi:hypothetical protein